MRNTTILAIIVAVLLAPIACADLDNYFSIWENDGPYDTLPGEEVVIGFKLANRDMMYPRNVTAYIDPCPYGWTCESKVFSFNKSDRHPENLTVSIPPTATPKKYVLYIMLESEYWTARGDDKVVVTVLSESQAKTLSYEEYVAKYEKQDEEPAKIYQPPEPEPLSEVSGDEKEGAASEETAAAEETAQPGADNATAQGAKDNSSDILDSVERLESSRQFVEYASIVLIVVLVFIAAGAYVTFKKED